MTPAEQPPALRLGGGRQLRRQRLAGQRAPRSQVFGLGDAPVSLLAGDSQPVGQSRAELATQLFAGGLRGELVDQRMPGDGQPARLNLQLVQHPQQLRSGQRLEGQPQHARHRGTQLAESRLDLLTIRTHVRIISRGSDTKCRVKTNVAQVV